MARRTVKSTLVIGIVAAIIATGFLLNEGRAAGSNGLANRPAQQLKGLLKEWNDAKAASKEAENALGQAYQDL